MACWSSFNCSHEEKGGFRPIAVGDVICQLASRLCCVTVNSRHPDLLLPYGQVGVGIKGGLEAAIHSVRAKMADVGTPLLVDLRPI